MPCWSAMATTGCSTDCGSTNGLWWRGRRVQQLVLRDGDQVRFGPAEEGGLPELSFERLTHQGLQRSPWRRAGVALAALHRSSPGGVRPLRPAHADPGTLAGVRGPLVLYDRTGRPDPSRRTSATGSCRRLGDYPPVLIAALLASEDSRFWWHPGVDPIGTGRALLTNLLGGRVLEGGSTLTQQLARSLYPDQVGQGETLERKWRELLVALQLEARFSKRDLLLSYLNRVYLGAGWGFEDASRRLFRQARLPADSWRRRPCWWACCPPPTANDPCLNPQAALAARNGVLTKMVATGRHRRRSGPRGAAPTDPAGGQAPAGASNGKPRPSTATRCAGIWRIWWGRDVAAEGNFLIDTHLDPALQAWWSGCCASRSEASRSLGVSQGAVVVLDSRNRRHPGDRRRPRLPPKPVQPGHHGPAATRQHLQAGALRGGPRAGSAALRWRQLRPPAAGGASSLTAAAAAPSACARPWPSAATPPPCAWRGGWDWSAVVQKARDLGITQPARPGAGPGAGPERSDPAGAHRRLRRRGQ